MKRIIFAYFVSCCLAASICSAQQQRESVNVVGFVRKTIPDPDDGWTMIGPPFVPVGGGDVTLQDMFGTEQLAQHDYSHALCDRVYMFDRASQQYLPFAQKTTGNFHPADETFIFSDPTNPVVEAGTAMWIMQPGTASGPKEIAVCGEAVSVVTQQVDMVGTGLWNMISYPFSNPIAITNTSLASNPDATGHDYNPAAADMIIRLENNLYKDYALKTDGLWYRADDFNTYQSNILATFTMDLGDGGWYLPQKSLNWLETNRYLNNL